MSDVRMQICIHFGLAFSRDLNAMVTSDILRLPYFLQLRVKPIMHSIPKLCVKNGGVRLGS